MAVRDRSLDASPEPLVPQSPLVPGGIAAHVPDPSTVGDLDTLKTQQLSQAQLIILRFRRHRLAMIGLATFLVIIALSIFGPMLMTESPYNALSFDPANSNISPTLHPLSWMFGTDVYGHSILSQILWGGRVSLIVGIASAMAVSVIGFVVGATAGYFGGTVDTIVMRVTDVFLTLPFLPILLVASAFFGQGNILLIIGIFSFFGWPGIARLVRSSYLSLRNQEFVEAARAVGVPTTRIIFRHIAPSALRPVIVAATLSVSSYILAEAAIDYLGVGIVQPTPSWGNILTGAENAFGSGNWWWVVFPGIMLVLTVLSVNFMGDGLGDALDVRSK